MKQDLRGDRQRACVWETNRCEPRGLAVRGAPRGCPSSCQWGGSPLPATWRGTGGPSAGCRGSGPCPLVSGCGRGSRPPLLLSAERSAGFGAAGELSDCRSLGFFFKVFHPLTSAYGCLLFPFLLCWASGVLVFLELEG